MALVGCGKTTSTGTTTGTTSEHTLVYHEAVAATCLADGNVKYYVCSSCGTYFADEEGSEETTLSAVAGASAKGIKSQNNITIADATVIVKTEEDGIHANAGTLESGATTDGNVTISSGTVTVELSEDDGIASDGAVTITGGTITVNSYDNGITGSEVSVSDGTLIVRSYSGDGVKSSSGDVIVTGGLFVCAGTSAELPSSSSQCYVKFSCGSSGMGGGGFGGGPGGNGRPGSSSSSSSGSGSTAYSFAAGTWYVKNSSGTTLFSFTLGTTYKGLWMCYSGFTKGNTYTITNGSTTYSWTQSSQGTTVG